MLEKHLLLQLYPLFYLVDNMANELMKLTISDLKYQTHLAFSDRPNGEKREEVAQRIIDERNPVLIKPYDDWHVMAGQGTIGLEVTSQLNALNLEADALVAPCGGGGLPNRLPGDRLGFFQAPLEQADILLKRAKFCPGFLA